MRHLDGERVITMEISKEPCAVEESPGVGGEQKEVKSPKEKLLGVSEDNDRHRMQDLSFQEVLRVPRTWKHRILPTDPSHLGPRTISFPTTSCAKGPPDKLRSRLPTRFLEIVSSSGRI